MADEIDLRAVDEGDRPFLVDLLAATMGNEWAAMGVHERTRAALAEMQFAAQLREYRARYPHGEDSLVLARGAPIGRLYVDRGIDAIQLIDIRLVPARWGSGTGTVLIRRLLEEADRDGRSVRLHVARANNARRLYERLGLRESTPQGGEGVYVAMERRSPARPQKLKPMKT